MLTRTTMRVVTQEVFGAPEVLRIQEHPVPSPAPTQIRVRVTAAGVNPVDWKTRAGQGIAGLLGDPPFVLGWDVAGVVDEVGFGVTRFRPGDRVHGMPLFPAAAGGYSEFVVAPSRQFARTPDTLDDVSAAAMPLAALTAWQALVDTAGVGPGQRVLVHGAGGGVGHLALQIARSRGATVIGTARAEKHDLLLSLGAEELIDYRRTPLSEAGHDVDVVLDLVGGADAAALVPTLRPGGLLICVPSGVPEQASLVARDRGVRTTGILVEPDGHALAQIADLVGAGTVQVVVSEQFDLTQVANAHKFGETGRTTGKIVLQVGD